MPPYARGATIQNSGLTPLSLTEQGETSARPLPLLERLIVCHAIELTVSSR